MDKIYISWEDSVENAVKRYKTVLENYRAGKYKREQTFADEWLGAEGEILDVMCRAKSRGRKIKNDFRHYGKNVYYSSLRAAESFNRRRIKLRYLAGKKRKEMEKEILKKLERYF